MVDAMIVREWLAKADEDFDAYQKTHHLSSFMKIVNI